MRRPLSILLALLLVSVTAASAVEFHGSVVGVTDGDTLKVLYAGREVRVRLYGMDAQEKRQPYGQRAKQYASDLASRREVTVRETDRDRYGGVVGWVTLPDGRSLNMEMVRAGLAWCYQHYAPADRNLEQFGPVRGGRSEG